MRLAVIAVAAVITLTSPCLASPAQTASGKCGTFIFAGRNYSGHCYDELNQNIDNVNGRSSLTFGGMAGTADAGLSFVLDPQREGRPTDSSYTASVREVIAGTNGKPRILPASGSCSVSHLGSGSYVLCTADTREGKFQTSYMITGPGSDAVLNFGRPSVNDEDGHDQVVAAAPACRDAHGTYTNSSGHEIRDPACVTGHIQGETAICRDGSHSMSEHRRGTCSRHGGVAQWE